MPDGLGPWMACLSFLVVFCYYGRMLYLSFLPKNGYVTKPQVEKFESYVRNSLDTLHAAVQKLVVSVAVLESKTK